MQQPTISKTLARMKAISSMAEKVKEDPGVRCFGTVPIGNGPISHWVTNRFFQSAPGLILVEPVDDEYIRGNVGQYRLLKKIDEKVEIYIYTLANRDAAKSSADKEENTPEITREAQAA